MRRRVDLDPRYQNRRVFVDERAPDRYRIINAIELGRRDNYEPGTIIALEAAYDLAPGAIARALDGGELEPRAVSPPPPLSVVPPPPASLEPGPADIFPDVEPAMRNLIDAKLPALRHLYRLAAIKGPDMSGTAIFTDSPHEAERWDRLVEAGYAEKPGEGYTPAELLFLMATGRVFDDQYRAASGDPARRRKALISIT